MSHQLNHQSFKVHQEGIRLDLFLSQMIEASRSQVEHFIKTIGVRVNDKAVKKCGLKLSVDDEVVVALATIDFSRSTSSDSSNVPIDFSVDFEVPIIYEDDDILMVHKPSGVTTHRSPNEKKATLVDWLQAQNIKLSTISGEERFGIVHRLDKPTSGILAVAKNNPSHIHLADQLQKRSMSRYYLAVISPPLKEDIIIDKPIGRNPHNRLLMSCDNPIKPKSAKSAFKKLLLSDCGSYELIGAKLFSGRTHQIRAHLKTLQRHIVGDNAYGFVSNRAWQKYGFEHKILLHAYYISLAHPNINQSTNKEISFSSDLDEDYLQFCNTYFNMELFYDSIDTSHFVNFFTDI